MKEIGDTRMLIVLVLIFLFFTAGCKNSDTNSETDHAPVWPVERAQSWAAGKPWFRGANFIPSTAINQLEFWQAGTFDPETINRELSWAADIGFNCMRVYLHHLAWKIDKSGFKRRVDEYLSLADKHDIVTIFVFFDDCWNPAYRAGKQPEPKPGVHNSGWVRDPGDLLFTSDSLKPALEAYVRDVIGAFRDDKRVLLWDLYNEPGNNELRNKSLPLLKDVFKWAREINPSQPLSAGVWNSELVELTRFQLENSDIITYHNYSDPSDHQRMIDRLKQYQRPLICTEYMARTRNSLFNNIMPILKKEKIGAINWGLVAGKSNTKYAWDTPVPGGSDPEVWFHDIFRPDGTPYNQEEVDLIRKLTGVQ